MTPRLICIGFFAWSTTMLTLYGCVSIGQSDEVSPDILAAAKRTTVEKTYDYSLEENEAAPFRAALRRFSDQRHLQLNEWVPSDSFGDVQISLDDDSGVSIEVSVNFTNADIDEAGSIHAELMCTAPCLGWNSLATAFDDFLRLNAQATNRGATNGEGRHSTSDDSFSRDNCHVMRMPTPWMRVKGCMKVSQDGLRLERLRLIFGWNEPVVIDAPPEVLRAVVKPVFSNPGIGTENYEGDPRPFKLRVEVSVAFDEASDPIVKGNLVRSELTMMYFPDSERTEIWIRDRHRDGASRKVWERPAQAGGNAASQKFPRYVFRDAD
jgi:hypothetical protein